MRLLLFLLLAGTATALNIIKSVGVPPSYADQKDGLTPVFRHYSVPLDPPYMALCGNGRVDSAADYAKYYTDTQRAKLMVDTSRVYLGGSITTKTEVQLSPDEMCDDGNRLDGDGCSADCMTFDTWVSPCQIPLGVDDIEDFDFYAGDIILSLKDGIYSVAPPAAMR